MDHSEIVFSGYYGQGNFGDDILLVVTHAVVSSLNPNARIYVRTNSRTDSVHKLVGKSVNIIDYGTDLDPGLIVHGGGGTYFDFSSHTGTLFKLYHLLVLRYLPWLHVFVDSFVRFLIGRPRMHAKRRVGLGIGIGTYAFGSKKLWHDLCDLADYDFLSLRDPMSATNLRNLGLSFSVHAGSDLAFLAQCWLPSALPMAPISKSPKRPKLGLILRDWPFSGRPSLNDLFLLHARALSHDYDITLISLDPSKDQSVLADFSFLPVYQWESSKDHIPTICSILSSQDLVITARAHGAICSACLGTPSLILNIEPKLSTVHRMLPNCTLLCDPPFSYSDITNALKHLHDVSHDAIMRDVMHNQRLTEEAIQMALPLMTL